MQQKPQPMVSVERQGRRLAGGRFALLLLLLADLAQTWPVPVAQQWLSVEFQRFLVSRGWGMQLRVLDAKFWAVLLVHSAPSTLGVVELVHGRWQPCSESVGSRVGPV